MWRCADGQRGVVSGKEFLISKLEKWSPAEQQPTMLCVRSRYGMPLFGSVERMRHGAGTVGARRATARGRKGKRECRSVEAARHRRRELQMATCDLD